MKAVVAITAIATVGGLAGAAIAQKQQLGDEDRALAALRTYATCAVQHTARGAERVLSMDIESPQYGEAIRSFARGHSYCSPAGSRLKFTGVLFAGDLAEALIRQGYAGQPLAPRFAVAAPEAYLPPHGWGEAIGMCVTRAEPAAVEAVLATAPGSDDEVHALDQTGSSLAGCIPKGKTLKINKPMVRAFYALGAWRLLSDKGAPPATGN